MRSKAADHVGRTGVPWLFADHLYKPAQLSANPGLGGRGNDVLTTVSGVPFGDDQSVCLHSP